MGDGWVTEAMTRQVSVPRLIETDSWVTFLLLRRSLKQSGVLENWAINNSESGRFGFGLIRGSAC